MNFDFNVIFDFSVQMDLMLTINLQCTNIQNWLFWLSWLKSACKHPGCYQTHTFQHLCLKSEVSVSLWPQNRVKYYTNCNVGFSFWLVQCKGWLGSVGSLLTVKMVKDRLLSFLQHGFLWSKENVILHKCWLHIWAWGNVILSKILNPWVALGF